MYRSSTRSGPASRLQGDISYVPAIIRFYLSEERFCERSYLMAEIFGNPRTCSSTSTTLVKAVGIGRLRMLRAQHPEQRDEFLRRIQTDRELRPRTPARASRAAQTHQRRLRRATSIFAVVLCGASFRSFPSGLRGTGGPRPLVGTRLRWSARTLSSQTNACFTRRDSLWIPYLAAEHTARLGDVFLGLTAIGRPTRAAPAGRGRHAAEGHGISVAGIEDAAPECG